MVKRIARRSTARMNGQLSVDRMDVPIDGVVAYEKALGDPFVAHSRREQAQHLDFTCRQLRIHGE